MGGSLKTNGFSYLPQRQGLFLAAGEDCQDYLVVYAAPPNPCRSRQYSMIKIALGGIDAFHRCAGDKIPARSYEAE